MGEVSISFLVVQDFLETNMPDIKQECHGVWLQTIRVRLLDKLAR